jgi:hypothetical protein
VLYYNVDPSPLTAIPTTLHNSFTNQHSVMGRIAIYPDVYQ